MGFKRSAPKPHAPKTLLQPPSLADVKRHHTPKITLDMALRYKQENLAPQGPSLAPRTKLCLLVGLRLAPPPVLQCKNKKRQRLLSLSFALCVRGFPIRMTHLLSSVSRLLLRQRGWPLQNPLRGRGCVRRSRSQSLPRRQPLHAAAHRTCLHGLH